MKKQKKMTNTATAIKTGTRPANRKVPAERRPINMKNQPWTPQPSGISREDMRRIVLEMIG
jgi:hypothetical protein